MQSICSNKALLVSLLACVTLQSTYIYYISIRNTRNKKQLQSELDKQKELRETERKGRISTQVKHRKEKLSYSIENGFNYQSIAVIESVFPDRRGTPRQPLLVTEAIGYIKFDKRIQYDYYKELEGFSHIWILFVFHENTNADNLKAKIKPPRLGEKVGCLSTRSPHRPNNIGLSVCKIVSVVDGCIEISGVDMVDGTPVIDIKPYVPSDSIPLDEKLMNGSYVNCFQNNKLIIPSWVYEHDITIRPVSFTSQALQNLNKLLLDSVVRQIKGFDHAVQLITQVLQQDIRGVHQGRGKVINHDNNEQNIYECRLDRMIIKFITLNAEISIVSINSIESNLS